MGLCLLRFRFCYLYSSFANLFFVCLYSSFCTNSLCDIRQVVIINNWGIKRRTALCKIFTLYLKEKKTYSMDTYYIFTSSTHSCMNMLMRCSFFFNGIQFTQEMSILSFFVCWIEQQNNLTKSSQRSLIHNCTQYFFIHETRTQIPFSKKKKWRKKKVLRENEWERERKIFIHFGFIKKGKKREKKRRSKEGSIDLNTILCLNVKC